MCVKIYMCLCSASHIYDTHTYILHACMKSYIIYMYMYIKAFM